jgi:hypothetical protein
MHRQYVTNSQVIMLPHGLLSQFAVQMVKLINAGRKRGHHVTPWALLLLPVDIVTQGIIEYRLKLSPLVLGNVSQRL